MLYALAKLRLLMVTLLEDSREGGSVECRVSKVQFSPVQGPLELNLNLNLLSLAQI